jgi:CHU_C Type IX secretion signal domain/SprB repeat/Calx-beta domain
MKYSLLTMAWAVACLPFSYAQERAQPLGKNDVVFAQQRSSSAAGITVEGGISAEELIKKVFIGGDCFDVSNVKYYGDPISIGKFDNGKSALALDKGIVMSTGSIKSAEGPNDSASYGSYSADLIGQDGDLKKLLNSTQKLRDQSVIEFDFVPTTNKIQFEFVFASEEYCEYVFSDYNDIFGFFLSGPGINGTFSKGAKNIALIPNTTQNVSINNINNATNSQYYVNNVSNLGNLNGSCPSLSSVGKYLSETQFDGFTKPLIATADVIPCQTYHIKLAIADVKDQGYDSAVFLKANSFNSGSNVIVAPSIPKTLGYDAQTVYEGCDSTAFTFTRLDNDLTQPLVIPFSIDVSSTATEGVDYQPIAKTVTIPIGATFVKVPINVLSDNQAEGDETIILSVDKSCSCSKAKIAIKIKDKKPLTLSVTDTAFCGTSKSITLSPTVKNSIGKVTYAWDTGETTNKINIKPAQSSNYILKIADECGQKTQDTATITLAPNPTASLKTTTYSICKENQAISLPVTLTGLSPYTISYSINGKIKTDTNIKLDAFLIKADTIGIIQLVAVSGAGCDGTVNGKVNILLDPIKLLPTVTNAKCNGGNDGSAQVNISGSGTAPYQYNWSNGSSNNHPKNFKKGNYTVTVTDVNQCQGTTSLTIDEPSPLGSKIIKTKPATCANPYGGYIEAIGFGGTPPYTFQWLDVKGKPFQKDSLQWGDYQAIVKDGNGCEATITATVKADTLAPKKLTYEAISPSCRTNFGSIVLKTAEGGVPPYTYAIDTFPTFSNEKLYTKLLPNVYGMSVKGSNGCILTTTIKVPEYFLPTIELTPLDTVILPGDSVLLTATHDLEDKAVKNITWTPATDLDCRDCLTPLAKPFKSTNYTIAVKDKFDCTVTATASIRVNKEVKVYIPNVIHFESMTRENTRLKVYANPRNVKGVNIISVFDRWGTKVYERENININDERDAWDGTFNNNGNPMPEGTYVYFTEVQLVNGERLKLSGDVVLLK